MPVHPRSTLRVGVSATIRRCAGDSLGVLAPAATSVSFGRSWSVPLERITASDSPSARGREGTSLHDARPRSDNRGRRPPEWPAPREARLTSSSRLRSVTPRHREPSNLRSMVGPMASAAWGCRAGSVCSRVERRSSISLACVEHVPAAEIVATFQARGGCVARSRRSVQGPRSSMHTVFFTDSPARCTSLARRAEHHFMTSDFYHDKRFCAQCREYVHYLQSITGAFCVECRGEVRMFSPNDLVAFRASVRGLQPTASATAS